MATTKALELAQLADSISVNANGEITNIGTLSSLDISGDISTSTLSATGGDVQFYEDNSGSPQAAMHWDYINGNLGIGLTNPNSNYLLHVAGVTYAQAGIQMDSGYKVNFGNSNQFIRGTNDTSIEIVTGATPSLTVLDNGNVTMAGDLTVTGDLTVNGNTTNVSTNNLVIEDLNITLANGAANSSVADGAGITIDGANATLTWHDGNGRFEFNKAIYATGNQSTFSSSLDAPIITHSTDGTTGIQFTDNSGTQSLYYRGADDVFYFSGSTVNVGINTSNPQFPLEVHGGQVRFRREGHDFYINPNYGNANTYSAVTSTLDISFRDGGDVNTFYFDNDNVRFGVNTDNPLNKLHIDNDGVSDGIRLKNVGADNFIVFENGVNSWYISHDGNNNSGSPNGISIVENGTDHRITAAPGGNVGINEPTPNYPLDVYGDINAQSAFRTDEVRADVRPALIMDFANAKKLDPRVEYSRSTTATYYDGKARALAEENTKKYSENFVNGYWNTKFYSSVNGNVVNAPNGLLQADELVEDNTNNAHYIHSPNSASELTGPHTYSVYAKANTRSVLGLWSTTVGNGIVYFDLSNGTYSITTGARVGSATMQDVGNGWYRCSFSTPTDYVVQANEYPVISMHSAVGTYSYQGDGSSSIYIWGAQLENRTTPSTYVGTYANPVKNYQNILTTAAVNTPRFDHYMGSGEVRGLLIEQEATNLNINSEALTNWGYNLNVTYQADVGIAPDGTKTADLIYGNTTSGQHYFGIPSGFSQGSGQETFSVFLKPFGNVYKLRLYLANQAGPYSQVFDFANGTMSTSGSGNLGQTMEDYGNGWWRCSFSWTATKTNPYPTLVFLDENDSNSFAMDGYSGVHVWGAQWENGRTFPSSYIKTTGSSVTRTGDYAVVNQLFDFFNPNEGTFFVDQEFPMQFSTDANTRYMLQINGSTILMIYKNSNSASINTYDGITGASRTPTTPGRNQIAMGYSRSQLLKNITINGSTSENALDGLAWGNTFETHQQLSFGQAHNNHGWVRKIAYYPKYLPTTATRALTENN